MTGSTSWLLRGPNPAALGISTADPGVSEESAKKGVHCRREEIWDAVPGRGLFWRAMAGCIATAVHWFVFFTLHEPITCSYNCVIEKGFSFFPILTSICTSEIVKGNFRGWLHCLTNSETLFLFRFDKKRAKSITIIIPALPYTKSNQYENTKH